MYYILKNKYLILILLLALFLRLWKIQSIPVSLFGDELDVGYHAYSILKTGKDYSGQPWPLHFHSMAEWRTPLYLYSVVPTVAIFGITPLGVRLPATLFGLLGVGLTYLTVKQLLIYHNKKKEEKNDDCNIEAVSLLSAFLMSISPWHIQYSRAAFEVTMLIAFLLLGIYFFFKALDGKGRLLWLSVTFLTFTPWIYSTAKLFTPFIILLLFLLYRKEILKISFSNILKAIIAGLIIGVPIAYSTVFGGGAERFNYISVFTDPVMEGDVGFARLNDARMFQKYGGVSLFSKVGARILHNKYTFWGEKIIDNFYSPLSSDFLFIKGDINLRHSIEGMGQFYKVDVIGLILGLILFFAFYNNLRAKILILGWVVLGIIPAAITRDGGTHATRLILILPPIIFLISYGLVGAITKLSTKLKLVAMFTYCLLLSINFFFYQHNYWVHNPWYSERWWHSGFKEMVDKVKEVENNYDKIIISNANEPPQIFFLGWYQYSPELWQKGLSEEYIPGFDTLQHTGKFYFGQVDVEGIYHLANVIQERTLYVAVERELGINLIMEPTRVPPGLNLVAAIEYPSGEPAFYLFEKGK